MNFRRRCRVSFKSCLLSYFRVLALAVSTILYSVSIGHAFLQKNGIVRNNARKDYATMDRLDSSDKAGSRISIPDLDVDQDMVDEILNVVVDASNKACEIIRKYSSGTEVVSTKATGRDLLTMVDPMCEKAIRETIMNRFPNHLFLGEESVAPGMDASRQALEDMLQNATSDWLFIVDPVDGTTNLASGIPLNMPSIAAAYKGVVWIAVLNDPHRNELFTAVRGRGAFMNGKQIHVGRATTLQDAVVGLESPAGQESLEACLRGIVPLMPRVRTIRMLGSSAVFLPWVAYGRLTAYWTPDECAWDIAAGALIVQEAGGRVTDVHGNDYTLRTRSLVASNGNVHDEILSILQEAKAIIE